MLVPERVRTTFLKIIAPVINFFIKRRLNPNHFTTIGLIVSIFAAYLFGSGRLRWGGLVMLIGGLFDVIDGRVARATNRVTKFGALYDSTLDRYSEVMIFFGLAYYFVTVPWQSGDINVSLIAAIAVSVAIGGSIMTSYVRARAEGLGLECKVGVMQRTERVLFISLGALIHNVALVVAIFLVAIFSNITAIQRVYHVWLTERRKGNPPAKGN
ncbi:MAG: CDP-alcohol phosphatidyltransferase family protein [Candidatus Zhuqueibacterota bacterium]